MCVNLHQNLVQETSTYVMCKFLSVCHQH